MFVLCFCVCKVCGSGVVELGYIWGYRGCGGERGGLFEFGGFVIVV